MRVIYLRRSIQVSINRSHLSKNPRNKMVIHDLKVLDKFLSNFSDDIDLNIKDIL